LPPSHGPALPLAPRAADVPPRGEPRHVPEEDGGQGQRERVRGTHPVMPHGRKKGPRLDRPRDKPRGRDPHPASERARREEDGRRREEEAEEREGPEDEPEAVAELVERGARHHARDLAEASVAARGDDLRVEPEPR